MKIFTLFLILCSLNAFSQSSKELEDYINRIDSQPGEIIKDSSMIKGWNKYRGNYEEPEYFQFKIQKQELVRVFINHPGTIRVYYYFKQGKLEGAKIEFMKDHKSWEGKIVSLKNIGFPKDGILISDPDDDSYDNVAPQLASSALAWQKYYLSRK